MTGVTQLIPSYLGGVSKQSDDKKKPGQVSNIVNGFPDITYGLLKRSGFNWLRNVADSGGQSLDNSKWFLIARGGLDSYVGVITPQTVSGGTTTRGNITVWNAITGVQATINYPNGRDYLDIEFEPTEHLGPEELYSITTIQDVSVITNQTTEIAELPSPAAPLLQNGTVKILLVEYGAVYRVIVNGENCEIKTRNFDDEGSADTDFLDATEILTDLKEQIDDKNIANLTVTVLSDCLELTFSGNSQFTQLGAIGGIGNSALESYLTDVVDISKLVTNSIEGRTVQITNSSGDEDDYWLEFDATDGTSGPGTWIECKDPAVSAGLDASTMPHELVLNSVNADTGVATFTFQEINWSQRLAGDFVTNPTPSFVGRQCSYTFFYRNRFGMLAEDNVILSMANDPYNFFKRSAQLLVASDPIDVNVSSVTPVKLISVRAEPQGLVLFGTNEQFRLYSVDSALTPQTAQVRTQSTYEISTFLPPQSMGTSVAFVSKVPAYSRVFLMETRGLDEQPRVVDIGKTVMQWIPSDISGISASPQNNLLMLYSSSSNEVYVYRYFNNGEKDLFQAWTKWELTGNVMGIYCVDDQIFTVTEQDSQYTLQVASLNRNNRNNIIEASVPLTDDVIWSNPYMDLQWNPDANDVVYNDQTNITTITLPFNSVPTLTPVVMLAAPSEGELSARTSLISLSQIYQRIQPGLKTTNTDSGYFVTPTVDGNTWTLNGNWSDDVNRMLCGYRFTYLVEFPTNYYNPGEEKYDITANLTIARHRFSVAFTGAIQVSLQAAGRAQWQPVYQVDDADYYLGDQAALVRERVITVPIYQLNKTYRLKIEDTTPYPTSLISQMWEGNYVPRFYKRKIN